jgi:hypothetical protein
MKKVTLILLLSCFALLAVAQTKDSPAKQPNPAKKLETVEAACGQCKFGLKGKGCDLAIRINNKAYFVDGTDIDSHGDAHDEHGFCNAIRKATVQGELKGDRFVVSYFKLMSGTEKTKK